MKPLRTIAGGVCLVALLLCGCVGSAQQTHDPELLNDDVLQQRVQAALQRAGSDFKAVRAQATAGMVDLTGKVETQTARGRAEQMARGVYGVKDVKNDVAVARNGQ